MPAFPQLSQGDLNNRGTLDAAGIGQHVRGSVDVEPSSLLTPKTVCSFIDNQFTVTPTDHPLDVGYVSVIDRRVTAVVELTCV